MISYQHIVKADYLQRIRSYTFLITLLVAVVIAHSFVPADDANYVTVRVGHYVGLNNAVWIGHVTAIMASTFLWLIGFYIINNGIRRDRESGVGQIIATTSISNFQYLVTKVFSNFLILLTLLGVIFLVAIGLWASRGAIYQFNLLQFLLPYVLCAIPSLFILSAVTVIFEVIFRERSNLMNVVFFIFFSTIISITNIPGQAVLSWFDPLGIKFLTDEMMTFVHKISTDQQLYTSVGFTIGKVGEIKRFLYEGSNFDFYFVLSRISWIFLALALLKINAKLFDRFDQKSKATKQRYSDFFSKKQEPINNTVFKISSGIQAKPNYSLLPLIKAELKLLIRKGKPWIWLFNLAGFVALIWIPLEYALNFGVPIIWFLQIGRWSEISTKEANYGTEKFIYSTFKPLQRLLTAQVLAGITLAVFLALPVILRLILNTQFLVALEVIMGAVILISYAICSGVVWGGKRFFEVTFFMITYMVLQGLTFLNYWGGVHFSINFLMSQILISIALLSMTFYIRRYLIKKQ